jgi:hypothetical protein
VEAAHTAAKRDEGLKKFYQRLVYRRGAAKAKVAVARKLLIRGYIILRDRVDYEEFLRRGVEARPARLATQAEVPGVCDWAAGLFFRGECERSLMG